MNKIEENLKCFQIFFNKLDNLNEQLKELMDIQNTINFNLQESIKHQKIILKYLIDLNNEAKIEKLKKKFFNKRYSSNQTKNNKKNEELFLSNKQFSEALKLKLTHTYKSNYIHSDEDFITKRNDNFQLNYNGFKIIKENNVEESNISNFSLLKKMSINKISNKSSPGKNGN
jgi:hemolysin activation/secretion protein